MNKPAGPAPRFDRYTDLGEGSLTPLLRDRGAVIYVLEFANGDYYVGQSVTMPHRFTDHRRRWSDIAAIQLRDVAREDLNSVERATIRQYRAAKRNLRNKAQNFGHSQESPLDDIVPVVDQRHWVLGQGEYEMRGFADQAARPKGPVPKMVKSREGRYPHASESCVADAIVADLGAIVAGVIPNAVSLEQTYWTISDYPATGPYGRMVTLNTGIAEVFRVPRAFFESMPHGVDGLSMCGFLNVPAGSQVPAGLPGVIDIERSVEYFTSTRVDVVQVAAGDMTLALRNEQLRLAARELALQLMRSGRPSRWARYHSMELARRAYEAAIST